MYTLGMLLLGAGLFLSLAGYAGLLMRAFRLGFLWVLGLLFIPFFAFFLLIIDFAGTWKWLLANFGGGVIMNFGLVFLMMAIQAEIDGLPASPGTAPTPSSSVPSMPGVYIPSEHVPAAQPGLLESVDPLLFAMLGGIGVFVLVGIVAGAILIGGMDDSETDGDDGLEPM